MDLNKFLEKKAEEYNQPFFIEADPISIPHMFTKKQDIEIAGFFAAIFSWGTRKTIINKSKELLELMDNSPHEFILNHSRQDLEKLMHFRHRTFNGTDLLYFISFLNMHYHKHKSLETAFNISIDKNDRNIERGLNEFYTYFFSLPDVPGRTQKHIASPAKRSACKRLCMFLRWMVRNEGAVDFGIWKKILPSQLIIPLDLHVARVARHFRLLKRNTNDWQAANELTESLRLMDAVDPVKFDYALFALGVLEKY